MSHIPHYHGAFAVSAAFSIATSSSVILTLFLFEKMRSKLFMRFIAFMALGDILGNIPYLYTWPYSPHSDWCYIGGVLLQTGSVSAWLWTSALCYMWHRASKRTLKGLTWHIMPTFHIICWGVPLAFALPSIALSSFENSTTYDGVCSTYGSYNARLYHNIWAYTLLVLCMIFMIVLYLDLVNLDQGRSRQSEVSVAQMRNVAAAKSTLVFYPILFIVFWLPKLILTTCYELLNASNTPFEKTIDICTCWYMFHGVAVAAVFFYNSPLARSLWRFQIKSILKKCGFIQNVEEDDDELSTPRDTVMDYADDADSLVDYRSTYADPVDTDLRMSASFRERQSSLQRSSALVPSSSTRVSWVVPPNEAPTGTKPANTRSSFQSAPTDSKYDHFGEPNQATITSQNLAQKRDQNASNLSTIANPIMKQWLNNAENEL
jgi:hypothetical protein